jgi:hypothetical protein
VKRDEEEERKAATIAALRELLASRSSSTSFPNELVEQDGVSEEGEENPSTRGRPRYPNR